MQNKCPFSKSVVLRSAIENYQREGLFTSNARFQLTISNCRSPRSQRALKAEKQAGSRLVLLIERYHYIVRKYNRDQRKSGDIAMVPPGLDLDS